MDWSKPTGRRDLLANLAVALTVIPGVAIAARYVLAYLVPKGRVPTREVMLARLEALPVGHSREFRGVLGNDLLVVRLGEGEVRAFSMICTHLGCRVQWDQQEGNFLCPCHMGRFDTTGTVIAGPPPTPLPSYQVRLERDAVYVTVPAKEV
jgi:cytochrome b6-f complex iron-sulfur subunit